MCLALLTAIMFASASFGAVMLLIPKRSAPYSVYASYLCFWIGGTGFSFVPFLFHFVPRPSWGVAMIIGNSLVVACLAELQFETWRSGKHLPPRS
jgi:hypothetical protein